MDGLLSRCIRPLSGFALALCVGGCTLTHKVEVTDAGTPKYDRLAIVYDVTDKGGVLTTAHLKPTRSNSVQLASFGHCANPAWRTARVNVQYPHPDGRHDVARVSLFLSYKSGSKFESDKQGLSVISKPAEILRASWKSEPAQVEQAVVKLGDEPPFSDSLPADEEWALDVPKWELDLLLVDLANSGFFDQHRAAGSGHLTVSIDDGTVDKSIVSEARLDELAIRTYHEGTQVGFSSCE